MEQFYLRFNQIDNDPLNLNLLFCFFLSTFVINKIVKQYC